MRCGGLIALPLLAGMLAAPGEVAARPHAPPPAWKNPAGEPVAPEQWLARLVGRYRFDGQVEVVFYPDRRCAPLPPDPAQQENPPLPPPPYCEGVKGMADCVAIGAGVGVHCIFNASWSDIFDIVMPDADAPLDQRTGVFNVPGGASNLAPSMALFGLEPHGAGLRFLLVDSKGLADGTSGAMNGSRAIFVTPCVNAATLFSRMREERIDNRPLQTCTQTIRFDARPQARVLNLSVDFEINDEIFTRWELQLRRVDEAPQAGAPGRRR
jgi:hypothetical protein